MDIDYKDFLMPSIVVASFCIGYIMKHWLPTDNKWIPTALGVFGAISGFIVLGFNFNAFATGLVSGLAAVGGHQIYKQLNKKLTNDEADCMTGTPFDADDYDNSDEEEVEEDE